jgi:hypothetical protein
MAFSKLFGNNLFPMAVRAAPDQLSWIQEKTEDWVASIKELAMVVER